MTSALLESIETADPGCAYVPSPQEIAAECEAIRAGWTPKETRRRRALAGTAVIRWTVPVHRTPARDVA